MKKEWTFKGGNIQVDLNSKVAFICGSTSGIGRAIALEMAKNGADIVLNKGSEASAEEAGEDIEQLVKN